MVNKVSSIAIVKGDGRYFLKRVSMALVILTKCEL